MSTALASPVSVSLFFLTPCCLRRVKDGNQHPRRYRRDEALMRCIQRPLTSHRRDEKANRIHSDTLRLELRISWIRVWSWRGAPLCLLAWAEGLLATVKTKTRTIRASHVPWQPHKIHSSEHLGGWGTPWCGRGNNAGWTTSKSRRHYPFRNSSRWLRAEKTERRSLLSHPSFPPDDPIGQGAVLNWTGRMEQLTQRLCPSVKEEGLWTEYISGRSWRSEIRGSFPLCLGKGNK